MFAFFLFSFFFFVFWNRHSLHLNWEISLTETRNTFYAEVLIFLFCFVFCLLLLMALMGLSFERSLWWWCREEAKVAIEVALVAAAPALGELMDLMTALQLVLRKSLAHRGLAKCLHEGAKVIEKHAAQLCLLAEDCDKPDYVRLVKGPCADHNVNILTALVPRPLASGLV